MSYHNLRRGDRGLDTDMWAKEPNGYLGVGAVATPRATVSPAPAFKAPLAPPPPSPPLRIARPAVLKARPVPTLTATPRLRLAKLIPRLQPKVAIYGGAPMIKTLPPPTPAGIARHMAMPVPRPVVVLAPPVIQVPAPPAGPPRRGRGAPSPAPPEELPEEFPEEFVEEFALELAPKAPPAAVREGLPIKWIALAGGGAVVLYLLLRRKT